MRTCETSSTRPRFAGRPTHATCRTCTCASHRARNDRAAPRMLTFTQPRAGLRARAPRTIKHSANGLSGDTAVEEEGHGDGASPCPPSNRDAARPPQRERQGHSSSRLSGRDRIEKEVPCKPSSGILFWVGLYCVAVGDSYSPLWSGFEVRYSVMRNRA